MRLVLFIACIFALFSSAEKLQKSEHTQDGKEVVCFVYHRFGDQRYPTTNVSLKDFEAHLRYLKTNSFQVLTLSEAIDYLKSESSPQKTAVLTIDDAYKSFYKNGFPLLKKYKMPATLFMNTKMVSAPDYMNWKELEDVIDAHVEIGNHTHSHNYFLNESASTRYKTFQNEIQISQSIIKKNLNIDPSVFSYPYGEFDDEMKNIVREAGFKCAAAQHAGVFTAETDGYDIPRFPMSEAYSEIGKFKEKAEMKALRVMNQSQSNPTLLLNDLRPKLTVTFRNDDLRLNQLQCFIQGADCNFRIVKSDDQQVTITIEPSKKLSDRRRTIFTLTVLDKSGTWHWYSHLFINTKVK